MKKALTVAVVLFIIFAFVQLATADGPAPTFDSQSPVGEWWSDWNFTPTVGGKFFLKVASVVGTKVSGEFELTGGKARGEKFRNGVLDGNILKITTQELYIEIVFEGKTMAGFALSGAYKEQRSEIKNGVKMK